MLLVLISAAFLGGRVNRARVQQEALSSIKRLNGYVLFDCQINGQGKYDPSAVRPQGPQWLVNLIGPEYFQTIYTVRIDRNFSGSRDPELRARFLKGLSDLRSLHLTHNQVTDEDLSCLESMPRLLRLSLMRSTKVGNGAAKRLEGLTELEELYLSDTRVTDIGLTSVRGKKLRVLFLSNLQVTDAGLTHLAGITSLQRLALDGTNVTDAGLVHLNGLPNLRELNLEGTHVTATGVARLQKALPGTRISCFHK